MATEPRTGGYFDGLTLPDADSVSGGGDDHPGLPLQPPHQEGGDGHPRVRDNEPQRGEHPPLRDDDGGGAATGERQHQDGADDGDIRRLHPGGDGPGGDGEGGEDTGIPGAGVPERPQLPDVADRYRGAPGQAVARPTEARLREWNQLLTTPEKLENLLTESLDTFHEILTVQTLPGEEDYVQIMRLKKEAAGAVIQTAVKLSDIQMERKNVSSLERLLEEAKLASRTVETERAAARAAPHTFEQSSETLESYREPEDLSPASPPIPE